MPHNHSLQYPGCHLLVLDGAAYFAAGRNTFLDGGIFLFALDPGTGKVLHRRRLHGPYGKNGFPMPLFSNLRRSNAIKGNRGDVMVADDMHVYLRHDAFTPALEPVAYTAPGKPHLMAVNGFTDGTVHQRSYWMLGRTLRYDMVVAKSSTHGDILVHDGSRFCEVRGFPPDPVKVMDIRQESYVVFAGQKPENKPDAPGKTGKSRWKKGSDNLYSRKAGLYHADERWTAKIPITGQAMVQAGDKLFVAGMPAVYPEGDVAKAYEGRMGGMLLVLSAEDGSILAEYKLDSVPVWDSMAATEGRLFLCTIDGKVRCFSK